MNSFTKRFDQYRWSRSKPQHNSFEVVRSSLAGTQNRNSDLSFSNKAIQGRDDRYSDYRLVPSNGTDRSSNTVVHEAGDVRQSGMTDRVVVERRSVRSNNRVSGIYRDTMTSWAATGPTDSLINFGIAEDVEEQPPAATQVEARKSPHIDEDPNGDRVEDEDDLGSEKEDVTSYLVSRHRSDLPSDVRIRDPVSSLLRSLISASAYPLDEPCTKVLPAALSLYKVDESLWPHYRICIPYYRYTIENGHQEWERMIKPMQKPLRIFSMLQLDHGSPQFILRKFPDEINGIPVDVLESW